MLFETSGVILNKTEGRKEWPGTNNQKNTRKFLREIVCGIIQDSVWSNV